MTNSIIMVEHEMKLKLELDNLVVLCGDQRVTYPLNKIECLVIDNMNASVTGRLLSKLAEENISLVTTDKKHLPIGIYSPYCGHSRSSKMLISQIEFNKNCGGLWQEIVRAKIMNQAKTLELLGFDDRVVDNLISYSNSVEIDDISNKESFAAKIYFNELMGVSFSRGNSEILINGALDYAYAIIRSMIAKVGIGYGLNMHLGIHHKNEYNDYNLADDLIEPFRPIVDLYVFKLMEGEEFFSSSHRKDIISIIYKKMLYKELHVDIGQAIEEYVKSFAKLVRENVNTIEYPNVINVEFATDKYKFEHYIDDYIFAEVERDEL